MTTAKQDFVRNELDLALISIKATRRQVNADLDAIAARIRRALPKAFNKTTGPQSDPEYWQKRFERVVKHD